MKVFKDLISCEIPEIIRFAPKFVRRNVPKSVRKRYLCNGVNKNANGSGECLTRSFLTGSGYGQAVVEASVHLS